MNVTFFSRISWLSLVLLWLAYALLGWYLSAHHIVWLVGAVVVAFALTIASKSSPLLERLVKIGSQGLLVVLVLSLIISISVALAATETILFSIIFIPLVTMILADLEMRCAGFSQQNTFLLLTIIAGFGLGFGEIIDILVLPSIRY